MKTLDEHNRHRWHEYTAANLQAPKLNGIACPHCRAEMFDSSPMQTLTSNPPMKRVHCAGCGFRGNRVI